MGQVLLAGSFTPAGGHPPATGDEPAPVWFAMRARLWASSVADASDESGFTVLELTVVILVIAALIAMSVPAYLGARARVQERGAQTDANNGFKAERILFGSTGQASSDATSTLPATEPALHWVADATPTNTAKNTVVVSVGTTSLPQDTVVLGVKAADGTCFYLRNYAGGAMQYGKDTACSSTTNSLVTGATSPAGGWKVTW